MKEFFENFILCGEINYVCLLCFESFTDVKDVHEHIKCRTHTNLLGKQSYIPKYAKNKIYKVNNYFYCEVCNYVTEKAGEIAAHVKNINHMDSTRVADRSTLPKYYGYKVVIDSKLMVKPTEWHGIFNDRCLFCDIKVNENEIDNHTARPRHLINLIPAKSVVEEGVYYREMNADLIYCYECRKIFTKQRFRHHLASQHNEVAQAERDANKLESFFVKDIINNVATCRRCLKLLPLKYIKMDRHRKKHLSVDAKKENAEGGSEIACVDYGRLRMKLKKYGKNHHITLNEGGSQGYCLLCDRYLYANIKNFKEHVRGLCHKGMLHANGFAIQPARTERRRYQTMPTKDFIVDRPEINPLKREELIYFNNGLITSYLAFLLLTQLHDKQRFKCFLCQQTFPGGTYNAAAFGHATSHIDELVDVGVVSSLKEEFVREVQTDVYHCGACNKVYPGRKLLDKHLQSQKHYYTNTDLQNSAEKKELIKVPT